MKNLKTFEKFDSNKKLNEEYTSSEAKSADQQVKLKILEGKYKEISQLHRKLDKEHLQLRDDLDILDDLNSKLNETLKHVKNSSDSAKKSAKT